MNQADFLPKLPRSDAWAAWQKQLQTQRDAKLAQHLRQRELFPRFSEYYQRLQALFRALEDRLDGRDASNSANSIIERGPSMKFQISYPEVSTPSKPQKRSHNRVQPGYSIRVWSIALLLLAGSFAGESQAINIFEPGFTDSFVSAVPSPDQREYGNISVSDNSDLYVTGGGGREVYRIRDGSSAAVAPSQVLAVGVFVDGSTLVFGDFPTGGVDTFNLYVYDLRANEFIRPPLDVRSFAGANDIVKAPPGWGDFGGKLIIAGTSTIYAFDLSSGQVTIVAETPSPQDVFNNIAFTPDNELIATTYTGNSIVRVDPNGTVTPLVNFPDRTEAVEVHQPSGDAFVVTNDGVTNAGNMYRVDLKSLQVTLFADGFTVNPFFFPHPLAFSKDNGTLYYGASEAGRYVIRQINGFETTVINNLVTFDPDPSTFKTVRETAGCPSGYVGKFRFDAELLNVSDKPLKDLRVQVAQLTRNNLVLTQDGVLLGEGGSFAVPLEDGYSDGILSPSESTDVSFKICLKTFRRFQFFVDVLGVVGGPALTFTPVQWTIELDDFGPGIHTIFMLANVSPLTVGDVQGLGGELIWEETKVTLCAELDRFVQIREVGDGYLQIGDGFQSNNQGPGCEINTTMENAFDEFGLPETACLSVTSRNVTSEYCAPLNVISDQALQSLLTSTATERTAGDTAKKAKKARKKPIKLIDKVKPKP